MWTKWIPWRYLVRRFARSKGLLDPFAVFSQLQRFSQPSEVAVPMELVRLSSILQARGLINAQAIQHNLDWVWPYWVNRQFDPHDRAFVPRAFSLTHINLTHRNWTAVGLPGVPEMPIVDPRGLVTPLYDGWSIDAWIVGGAEDLLPSKCASADQELVTDPGVAVRTLSSNGAHRIQSLADVRNEDGVPVCRIRVAGESAQDAWLALSLRPYNPEGVSWVRSVAFEKDGWTVNRRHRVHFSLDPERTALSAYKDGDVYRRILETDDRREVTCETGMATAAALFRLAAGRERGVEIRIPLEKRAPSKRRVSSAPFEEDWPRALAPACRFETPNARWRFLYEAALRSVILCSPGEVFPGPFTYKQFWFRDTAMIAHALLAAGLCGRAERVLDTFPGRQTSFGYFRSQDGEWDSNGQALWVMDRFCAMTGAAPKREWLGAVERAARWIERKRTKKGGPPRHAGLLPAGFSAEHFGPNNFYYWDDFWAARGLLAAASLVRRAGSDEALAAHLDAAGEDLTGCIDASLALLEAQLGFPAMPASPYRRMDSGAIGSLVASYPLRLWPAKDRRILATADWLYRVFFFAGGFFHDMSHSGINPYLTLHLAQVFLRAGDPRSVKIMRELSELASPTGQWPEAIHPQTRGGCMGDGQHAWASAEWILMTRNCLLREEDGRLILGSGLDPTWFGGSGRVRFGPAPTEFGPVNLEVDRQADRLIFSWTADWRGTPPEIVIHLPGEEPVSVRAGEREAAVQAGSFR